MTNWGFVYVISPVLGSFARYFSDELKAIVVKAEDVVVCVVVVVVVAARLVIFVAHDAGVAIVYGGDGVNFGL